MTLAAPAAQAAIVTTYDISGSAGILVGEAGEQTVTAGGSPFYEALSTRDVPPSSAAVTFGEISQNVNGIEFQNAVAGYGSASTATSTTRIEQTVVNDSGSIKQVNFTGLIYGGILGLWAPDLANCSAGALFDCPAVQVDGLPQSAPAVYGGPAEASLLISLTANGQIILEIDLAVGVGEGSLNGDNIVLSLSDGEGFLNDFSRLGGPDDGSLLFGWNDTVINPIVGLLEPGESMDVVFSVTSSFATFGDCTGSISQCVAAVACYGDPIGGGSDGSIRGSRLSGVLELFASARVSTAPAPTCNIALNDVDVPEPAPFGLLGLGLLTVGWLRRLAAR